MTDPKTKTKPRRKRAPKTDRPKLDLPAKPSDVEGTDGERPTFRKRTDAGNAQRLADFADGKLLWVHGQGWLAWDGKRWQRDQSEQATRYAIETARRIYGEGTAIGENAAKATDGDEAKAWGEQSKKTMAWAAQSESGRSIAAMLRLARSERRLVLADGALGLDPDPYALNVANGILDLQTRKLRDHDPAEHHTKLAAAEFDPDARSEVWDGFLSRILPSEEVRRWVQKWAGSTLRGVFSEELPVLWGSTKNGKSTFLRAVRGALGDYAMEAAPELLIRKSNSRGAGDMAAMADLQGRRFVTTVETGQGKRIDEVFVKQLTGEHVMKAKFMRQDWFEFENQASIALGTNHRPEVQGADQAMWERLFLVPFTVFIPEEERDAKLGDKLEAPEVQAAILAWLVEGLRLFDAEGLRPAPEEIQAATRSYQAEMDPIQGWLDSECDLEDADATTPIKWVNESYASWCEHTGIRQLSEAEFREALDAHGLVRADKAERRAGKPRKVYEGVRLVHDEDWHHEVIERMCSDA
jgi:putative DNA primase/helicase